MNKLFRRMQKLVTVSFIVTVACFGSAEACSRKAQGEAERFADFEKAKYVFRGLVTKVEIINVEVNMEGVYPIKVHYDPIEALKGNVPEDGYILSYTGYFGGCAVPVLVGLEYLFAPILENSGVDFKTNPDLGLLFKGSIGLISIFNTTQLPRYKPRMDEAMSEIRKWSENQR